MLQPHPNRLGADTERPGDLDIPLTSNYERGELIPEPLGLMAGTPAWTTDADRPRILIPRFHAVHLDRQGDNSP
jgi:hypothetical protein